MGVHNPHTIPMLVKWMEQTDEISSDNLSGYKNSQAMALQDNMRTIMNYHYAKVKSLSKCETYARILNHYILAWYKIPLCVGISGYEG